MSLPAVHYEVLALASKYHINTVHYSAAAVKEAVYGQSSLAMLYFKLHVVFNFPFYHCT